MKVEAPIEAFPRTVADTWLARIVQIFTLVGKFEWLEGGQTAMSTSDLNQTERCRVLLELAVCKTTPHAGESVGVADEKKYLGGFGTWKAR